MAGRKVLLFLAEGFEDMEAAAILSVCGWTGYRDHLARVHVVTAGLHREVRGRFGLRITTDLLLPEVESQDYSALAVPGGFHSHGFDEAYCEPLRDIARDIHARGGTIATMCVGILPVAEAGLLKGEKGTSYAFSRNHDNLGRLRELGCTPTCGPVEISNRIISCSGPSRSLEVAMLLLRSLVGDDAAGEVAVFMTGTEQ